MKCAQCGTEFVPKRASARFCSPKCRLLAHREADKSLPVVNLPPAASPEHRSEEKVVVADKVWTPPQTFKVEDEGVPKVCFPVGTKEEVAIADKILSNYLV